MRSLPRTNTRVIHLLALPFAILLLISSGASADDWSYDFDGAEPAGWTIDHVTLPPGGTSATFIASIESDGTDNHLRMSDTTNASATGSFGAFAGTGDIFMDAAISAEINITQDTDDDLGVVLRVDPNTGAGYFGSVDFERGNACITKIQGYTTGVDIACSADGLFTPTETYPLMFSAVGDSTTNLQLDVYDSAGMLLETVLAVDDGSIDGFGAAYAGGVSGVFMVPMGETLADVEMDQLNGTFDNISAHALPAVPEPSAGCLLAFGLFGIIGFRRRNRK